MRGAHLREKIPQVGARFEHQRAPEFAVQRVLDDHVEYPHTVIEKNLQLLFGSLGRVFARKYRAVASRGIFRQAIAARRCQNFLAARAENGHILHQALPTHAEMPCDLATWNGPAVAAQPLHDLTPPTVGIQHARPGAFSRCCGSADPGCGLLSCHLSSLL